MRRMMIGTTRTLIAGLLVMGLLALTGAWSQAQDPLQDVEQRLTEKRTAAETHRKQMEGIKDPKKLSTEMRRHFQMTEEVLALMLERQKLLKAQASSSPAGQAGGMQGGGMQGMGTGNPPSGDAPGAMKPTGNMGGMGAAASRPGGAMGMMGMMDKMMGMMDKMEMGGMGGGSSSSRGMGMENKMEMAGMMGMMGGMGGQGGSGMAMPSALPGFPGASHLYHIGATGFFLDHPQHIALSTEQQRMLNQIKEQAALDKASADRSVQEAEQALWTLTAAEQPDNAQIEAKVAEIEKLRGDVRLRFIRAVGGAAQILTDEQRKILTGFAPPAAAAPMPAGGMKDM